MSAQSNPLITHWLAYQWIQKLHQHVPYRPGFQSKFLVFLDEFSSQIREFQAQIFGRRRKKFPYLCSLILTYHCKRKIELMSWKTVAMNKSPKQGSALRASRFVPSVLFQNILKQFSWRHGSLIMNKQCTYWICGTKLGWKGRLQLFFEFLMYDDVIISRLSH